MSTYGTKVAELFSAKLNKKVYEESVADFITNKDWEGEIKGKFSKLNITTLSTGDLLDYTGADMSVEEPTESVGLLHTDQAKAFYFKIRSVLKFYSAIKNPESTLLDDKAQKLKKAIDAFVLGKYGDVAAGNRIGSDYTTGTVDIDANGNVTGTGTTFTSAMVGRGFKASGHSKWYRVKSVASATSMVIEQDLDDEDATYDGGVISGDSYTVEAASPVTVDTSNLYNYVAKMKEKLDKAEVPSSNRWLVIPPEINTVLLEADKITLAVPNAYEGVIKRGGLGQLLGFDVFVNNQVAGDNTNGFHVLAGHTSWQTFAMGMTESGIEDLTANFGKAYKGLSIYGSKVLDENRNRAVELFCKA